MNTIEQEVGTVVQTNITFDVLNAEDLNRATVCIKRVKGLMDKVNDTFSPIIDKAHKAHKEAISQRDKYLKPLQDVERKFKLAILVYTQKKETEQRELERRTNEELAKIADANKQKLLQDAKDTTNDWEAETLKEQAEAVVPVTVVVSKKVIEQEGLSIRKIWKARVTDIKLVPREYLMINQPMIDLLARTTKGPCLVPGIECYVEKSASVRA